MKHTAKQLTEVKNYLSNLYKTNLSTRNTTKIEGTKLYRHKDNTANDSSVSAIVVVYTSQHTTVDYEEVIEDVIVCLDENGEVEDCCEKYNLCDQNDRENFMEGLELFNITK
jgi:hypothetical protein